MINSQVSRRYLESNLNPSCCSLKRPSDLCRGESRQGANRQEMKYEAGHFPLFFPLHSPPPCPPPHYPHPGGCLSYVSTMMSSSRVDSSFMCYRFLLEPSGFSLQP